ncbi:unnamed protein product [Sphagnum jensenii]|uniref:Molybdenum cofactor sulfurase n=1 Tax=Sphagnum jensenii TaxID=128206 RepID=A0ABP0WYH4_9BRYO
MYGIKNNHTGLICPRVIHVSTSISSRLHAATTSRKSANSSSTSGRAGVRKDFLKRTALGTGTEHSFCTPESLPSLEVAFSSFKQVYPRYQETVAVDCLREREYAHLGENGHVCMDYYGFGLFSQWQQVMEHASSSFRLAYISANLPTQALYGCADDGSIEFYMQKRIMRYMNVNEAEYSMVFTSSGGSAYKLLAESYPFHTNNRLLTLYDYESEAVNWMVETARDKGAKIMTASFKWPSLRVVASDLKYKLQEKKKKKKEQQAKGLFVFPVQSRFTGAKYSYQWMSQAQANEWHVLLDASALGPKDMDSLGLSLFQPEFIVTSFYKVFGADPTGFGCLFIKNSVIQSLQTSSRARGVGMVRIVPLGASNSFSPAFSEGKIEVQHEDGDADSKNEDSFVPEDMQADEIEEFLDAEDWSSPGNNADSVSSYSDPVSHFSTRHGSSLDRMSTGGSVNSGRNSEIGSIAGSHDDEIVMSAKSDIGEGEVTDQEECGDSLPRGHWDMENVPGRTVNLETSLPCDNDVENGGGTEVEVSEVRGLREEEEAAASEFDLSGRGLQSPRRAVVLQVDEAFEEHHLSEPRNSSLIIDGSDNRGHEDLEQEGHFKLDKEDIIPHQGFREYPSPSQIGEDLVNGSNVTCFYTQQEIQEDTLDEEAEAISRNGNAGSWSPQLVNLSETHEGLWEGSNINHRISNHSEMIPQVDKIGTGGEEDIRLESADLVGSRVICKGDQEHFLMEGREAGRFSRHRQILSSVQENFEAQAELGVNEREIYDGTNGRRWQYWSSGEGSNKWAELYAMSMDGSPVYYDNEGGGGSPEESEPEMMDDSDGVVCSGLDHADSQGLNKTNQRLRYLTNWVINSLLKLQHPAQIEGQGTPLVHIYGPGVQFDRGASVTFNIFDRSGVLVQPSLVQRLADRSNISLGLGKLCNIIYPEGLQDLWGGKTDRRLETPRPSNANKVDKPVSIPVVTATLGFVTNFEDVHRLWTFVAKFLDVDFVSQESWQYHSLNQETVVL